MRSKGGRPLGDGDDSAHLSSRYQAFRFAWSVFPRGQRRLVFLKLVSEIAAGLLGAVPPLLIRMLLDDVLPRRSTTGLAELVLVGAVVYALLATTGVADQWLQSRISEGLGLALRERFFGKVLRLPYAFFVHTGSGSLVSRLTVDVRTAQGIIQNGNSVLSSGLSFVITVSVMLWLSPLVTGVVLVMVPIVVLVDRWFSPRIAEQSRRRLVANALMIGYTTERTNTGGALLIRTFGDTDAEQEGFARRSGRVWSTAIRSAVLNRSYYGILAVCAGFGILTVLYLGGRLVIGGTLQLGTLVALAQYANRSYQPVTSIARTRMRILDAAVALNRIKAFLDIDVRVPGELPPAPATPLAAVSSEPAHIDPVPSDPVPSDPVPSEPVLTGRALSEVAFDDVWFRYPDVRAGGDTDGDPLPVLVPGTSPWVLRGVGFRVPAGAKLAIVGESGAGKSTIGCLLAGLVDPLRGHVRLGGADAARLPEERRRRLVGLVTQEPFLFSGTLAENIRYGRPDASADDVAHACRVAGIHDAITALPDGYATRVGERGYRLSGGQKQRVALARALLSQCPVVLLDEATSHLDAAMDERIQRDLMAELPGRILIVIAHRLSTVADADEIVVLHDGLIAERGDHDRLFAADGYYASLFRLQERTGEPTTARPRFQVVNERTGP